MTTVSTATTGDIYWGVGGEYGPFPEQKTGEWAGWPDFGKVMHYFREKKAQMSVEEFAEKYGKATKADHSPISERQVRRMEYENEVPVDMNKRRFIANLLNIPPMLFGLAVLEDITLQPHPKVAGAHLAIGQTKLTKVLADTAKYQNNLHTLWILHETSEAQSQLDQISADIQDLEHLESQARGDLLSLIRELLFSYHILAAHVVRDQRNFGLSHHHANQAVRLAKAEQDCDLTATALSTRGCTYLEWGMFGLLSQGIFQIQEEKIRRAIRDFEEAIHTPENGEEDLHPQLLGFIRIHLSHAYVILKLNNGERIPAFTLTMLDDTAENIEKQNIDDPYQRVLVTGFRQPLTLQGLHTARASTFNAGKMAGAALQEINAIENLQQGTLGKDLTRSYAWLDIVTANAYLGLEQFEEATRRARSALLSSKDIHSTTNLTNIVDIHGRLLKSPYKKNDDVRDLGDMIRVTLSNRIERKNELLEEQYEKERDY